jgi:PAS domain S-box-containing protein
MAMSRPVQILHLENSPRDAELVREALRQSNLACELRLARSRAEYETALVQTRFDMILSDYSLPDYDGLAALALLREKQPVVPFLLITGTLDDKQAMDCVLRGATDYVLKRRLELLVPVVRRALKDAEKLRKHRQTLRESEQRYRTLFERAQDGMALFEAATGLLVKCNQALCRMVERTPTELEGQPQSILFPREGQSDGLSTTFRTHQIGDSTRVLEDGLLSKNGSVIAVDIRASPIRIDGRDYLLGIFRDITERKRAENALRQSAADLHALTSRLNSVREEERKTLSRELHDRFGQNLTALQFVLAWLNLQLRSAAPPDLGVLCGKVATMERLVEYLTELTQNISSSLRLGVLDDLGLVAAIEWQAADFEKLTGLPCAALLPPEDLALDTDCALTLFRIMQEALTNVTRHAQAKRVDIRLRRVGSDLELEIQDDGRGFVSGVIFGPNALGVIGMRERASAFGGTLAVLSEPGRGTTVRVRVPATCERKIGKAE